MHKFVKHLSLVGMSFLMLPAMADVKISNLQDFDFGLYPGAGLLQDDKNICVNVIPTGGYQIVMYGDGIGGRFEVSNGVDFLPYSVFYNDRARAPGGKRVYEGQLQTGQRRASNQLDCTDGLNANIRVRLRAADLTSANPGRYQGTLFMTISPE